MSKTDRAFRRGWIPQFSLCHPSARPEEALRTRDKWIKAASGLIEVEHVLCLDFGTSSITQKDVSPGRLVWNYGKQCSVDATNQACACAVGRVLVVISDDFEPCPNWDTELKKIGPLWSDKECVVRVRTGGTRDGDLFTIQILNRKRYEHLGYLFHPAYVSMYADDEFTMHAVQDGVVVEALHLLFPHRHWTTGERPMDAVYQRQNSRHRYEYGKLVLDERKTAKFPQSLAVPYMIHMPGYQAPKPWMELRPTL
jgi:hypothetical protein